jgi:hypothetical protein
MYFSQLVLITMTAPIELTTFPTYPQAFLASLASCATCTSLLMAAHHSALGFLANQLIFHCQISHHQCDLETFNNSYMLADSNLICKF